MAEVLILGVILSALFSNSKNFDVVCSCVVFGVVVYACFWIGGAGMFLGLFLILLLAFAMFGG